HELAPVPEGHDEDGAHAQLAASSGVNARIRFGVVAALEHADAETFSGESSVIETHTEVGRGATSRGAAYHLAVTSKSDGSAGGSGGETGLLHDLIEDEIQGQIFRGSASAVGSQGAGEAADFRVGGQVPIDVALGVGIRRWLEGIIRAVGVR